MKPSTRDFEAEFNRMCELNEKLIRELEAVKSEFNNMKTEFDRMKAQLDIVHLIFGNK